MSDQWDPTFEENLAEFFEGDEWMRHDWARNLHRSLPSHMSGAAEQIGTIQNFNISDESLEISIWDAGPLVQNPSIRTEGHQDDLVDACDDNDHTQVTDFKSISRIVYGKTACTTCNAPLDLSQQETNFERPDLYCTQTGSSDHHALQCDSGGCGQTFASFEELRKHSKSSKHKSFWCRAPNCNARLSAFLLDSDRHFSICHPECLLKCAQCTAGFNTRSALDHHGYTQSHVVYACQFPDCGSRASQVDELVRHQLLHQTRVKRYPCKFCRKYRGNDGFKRKDHLRQHISNYHHIDEPKENQTILCDWPCYQRFIYDDYPAHMLEKHQSKPYPCKQKNCDRIKMNGLDTKEQLKAHVKKDHIPDFPCTEPGCERTGQKGYAVQWALVKHMKKEHSDEVVQTQESPAVEEVFGTELDGGELDGYWVS